MPQQQPEQEEEEEHEHDDLLFVGVFERLASWQCAIAAGHDVNAPAQARRIPTQNYVVMECEP